MADKQCAYEPLWHHNQIKFYIITKLVPRTIESSQNNTRLPSSIARLGISFIFATSERIS